MAVLIKNIDKPSDCYACHFSLRITNANTICLLVRDSDSVEDGAPIPPYCPIKEATKIGREYIGYGVYDTWRTND